MQSCYPHSWDREIMFSILNIMHIIAYLSIHYDIKQR